MKQAPLQNEKNFEKKAAYIINKHKYNYANEVQNNFYKMIITNMTSEKSHRIRLQYTERMFEIIRKDILIRFYKKSKFYSIIRIIISSNNNNIFFPNYFVNENVYPIMERYMEYKKQIILRKKKDDKINYPIISNKKIYRYKEISNKIVESSSENENIDLENNLKYLNEDSSSKSSINSSTAVKKLINGLNNNLENIKKNKKNLNKKMVKLTTKIYDNKKNKIDNKLKIKRMNSETKPISVNQNKIIQKLYLDDFLFKKFGLLKNESKKEDEKEKKYNYYKNKINLETFSNKESYDNINTINIHNYKYKNKKQERKYFYHFKPTNLFISNFFKHQNLNKNKMLKHSIINIIKEYETSKSQKILSFLKTKKKVLTKNFTLSSSRKQLKKIFVQRDGFTTEITPINEIFNIKKLKEERILHLKEENNEDYLKPEFIFYNKNKTKYINSESMNERIRLNIRRLMNNKKYINITNLLNKNI